MFQRIGLAVIAVTMLPVFASAQGGPENLGISVELREEIRDSFIFVFTDDVASSDVRGKANAMARGNGGSVTRVYTTALKGFAAKMPADAAERLAAQNPNIDYYEPDGVAFAFKRPTSPGGGGDTGGCATPQETPWGITRVGGGGHVGQVKLDDPSNSSGKRAWVIDTGIDLTNPDLNVDVDKSVSFVFRGSPDDGHGHGTHVAGTIAAIDNECDVVGVAPGAIVVAVRVLDNRGSGSWSGVIAGIDHVAKYAGLGDVANMSLGGGLNKAVNDAVQNAAEGKDGNEPVLFAIAAGNSSINADGYSPASAGSDGLGGYYDGVYTVSAIDVNNKFAWFSNYGNPPIYCAAPGVDVLSLKRGGGTVSYSGTSMAAPHVAGLLLLGGPVIDGETNGTATGDPDGNPDPICHD